MNLDARLPAGTRLVSLAERPDLVLPVGRHNGAVWAEFLLQDPVADRLWHYLDQELAACQLVLLGEGDTIVATANSAPLAWDGTPDGLPHGWDDQMERSVAGLLDGTPANTLGALQIVVAPGRQGAGISAVMLGALMDMARRLGHGNLIACVRPNQKHRYPLMAMAEYVAWRRADDLPFDPWLRVHVRAGGEIVRVASESMTISGTLADWRTWTGLEFPVSGPYVVEGALEPVRADVPADRIEYHDANVWVVHRLR